MRIPNTKNLTYSQYKVSCYEVLRCTISPYRRTPEGQQRDLRVSRRARPSLPPQPLLTRCMDNVAIVYKIAVGHQQIPLPMILVLALDICAN